ncbi:MAG: ABC transporter ATP-binding protein [Acidobacteriota bacterium]|nr:ABC transporter ATP-binding protein/permease [Blastocatellia bacterium]MDW8413513.1 ABC transporter ATP-binding protein [Acidobacteriota bacterium]
MYYKRYIGKLLSGMVSVCLSAIIGLTAPAVVRTAVDDLQVSITHSKLAVYALAVIGIALAKGVFLFLQRRIIVGMSRDIENDLRNDYYAHLQSLSQSFFQHNRAGDLMARATNDISAVRMLIGPAVMYGLNTIIVTLVALPAMLRIDIELTCLVFLTMPVVSIATQYFSKRIHDRFEQVQELFSALTARAQESLSGIRVIRAYVREDYEIREFSRLGREYVKHNLSLIKLNALFLPVLHAAIGIGPVICLWYGGGLVAKGEITVGQFVEFNLYMVLMIWPMIALGWIISLYQRGMASMGRINQILNTKPEIKNESESDFKITGSIEMRSLNFGYLPDKPVLKDINLKIDAGMTVAIVGHTGSGKSTLLNLIPRLFDVPEGQLLIDDKPIKQIPLATLRRSIGYAPQESFLFSDTIAGNIAFGTDEVSREQIELAANQAGLSADIESFPAGLDTIVGERGITLSGGQKQRVALARALIRNPQILLLDDALSAVDIETEERILPQLRNIQQGRTCLIVSHRVSTIKHADLIVVLKDGSIVEQGKHDDLLAAGGTYAELYEKQLLQEELASN